VIGIDEDAEVDSPQDPSLNFYATGQDGKALKLHKRVASVAIGVGGQQWQEAFEEEISEYTDEQIIAMAPFHFIGRGIAGIDEMAQVLHDSNDSQVYFGVLQIQIGDGTFARYKNIFIHFQGEKMKAIARAKANRRLALAKDIIGACNAPLVVTNAQQFTVEWVFEELKRVFEGDNIAYKGKGQMTDLNTLRVNYKARMEKAKAEAEEERQRMLLEKEHMEKEAKRQAAEEEQRRMEELKREAEAKKRAMENDKKRKAEEERRLRHEREEQERLQQAEAEKKRLEEELKKNPNANVEDLKPTKTKKKKKGRKKKKKDDWSDDRPWTPQRVLDCIHSDISPFNWGLFKPSQKEVKPIKWGHGNLNVLRAELKDDQVQYGLMRLSFGSGRFRRNYWVYFLWTPDTMTMEHKKGRLRSKHVSFNGEMQRMLAPWNISLTVETKEKVTIKDWIMRVKRTVVIDGDDDKFTEEEYQRALEEEAKYIAELKAKEQAAKIQRDKEEQIEKLKNMQEETVKRKQKAERRQSAEFTKLNLKAVKINLGMPAPDNHPASTPIMDHDGHYSMDLRFSNVADQKMLDAANDANDANEDETKHASGDDEEEEEEEEREPSPEPVIELSAEEIAVLDAERKRKEVIELAKRQENEMKYRDVLQSKLVLESVELVKRTSEKLCWILFAPQRL